jgi:hypothetical protein
MSETEEMKLFDTMALGHGLVFPFTWAEEVRIYLLLGKFVRHSLQAKQPIHGIQYIVSSLLLKYGGDGIAILGLLKSFFKNIVHVVRNHRL